MELWHGAVTAGVAIGIPVAIRYLFVSQSACKNQRDECKSGMCAKITQTGDVVEKLRHDVSEMHATMTGVSERFDQFLTEYRAKN